MTAVEVVGVARWLAEVFGVGEPVRLARVGRGAMGAVWELRATAGVFAAKQLFWFDGGMAAVEAEVAFRAACAEAGVPSPAPLAAVDGAYVVRRGGQWWRLYEWADGEVPDRSDAEAAGWLAQQMGAIHGLDWPGGKTEVVSWYHRVEVDWPSLVALADSARVEWADALARSQPRVAELTALVNAAPIGEPVWCHRDLQNSNVLRSAGRSWLVDWDNVGSLAPWRELGALLTHHLDRPDELHRIVGAYRTAGGPAEIDSPTGFATGLAISLNFLHEQASVALDAGAAGQHRQFAEKQVRALLDSLPSLATLEQASRAAR
ncbi:phosphotransferase enzyme family protein [Kribbella sp. CA-293567]|uniref:phosphotransferase enzyme family protein n=1 Tax=Kribbella sp. CA-293567 TaxID=3002436 RepID=UPI0022DDDE19|nr:phosphotransferase [Kribbella sp. CA-293567]WBQ02000.1 phosphotransferase [Kribbella sp. CA-293567]